MRNEVRNSIFPHSVLNCLVSLLAPPVIMFSKQAVRLPIVRRVHELLWSIARKLPLYVKLLKANPF